MLLMCMYDSGISVEVDGECVGVVRVGVEFRRTVIAYVIHALG